MKSSCTIIFLLALVVGVTNAIVYNPEIISPNESSKWRAGETYTIQWSPTISGQSIPEEIKGTIMLGYLEDGSMNENLHWTLAKDFQLSSGAQSITLPSDLETKTSYIIVVMGNSGNASAKFTIRASRS